MDAETRAELAALRAEVAQLRATQGTPRPIARWKRRGAALAVAGLVALTPLIGLAAVPQFSDLGAAAPIHQPDIQAIAMLGITTGFDDPANPGKRLYDPKGLVTREEMASFLARTAGLGLNPPIANAASAQVANTVRTTTVTNAVTIRPQESSVVTVLCPLARRVIAGGYEVIAGGNRLVAAPTTSGPLTQQDGREGWTLGLETNTTGAPDSGTAGYDQTFTVTAICVGP